MTAGDNHPLKDKLPFPLLAAISALPPLSVDMYLPAMPAMAEDMNTQISVIQNSLSVFLVAFGVGMLLFGPLSDRFGRRPLAIFGLAGFGITCLLLALSPSVNSFLVLRFFQGLLGSAATITVPAMIRDCLGKDTAKGISTVTMIMLSAPLVAPLIGSVLLTFSSWRSVFYALSLYATVVFLMTLKKLPETLLANNAAPVSFVRNYLAILATGKIYVFLATFLMSSIAFFTYLTSAPFVYITWFGVSEIGFGIIFTSTAAALILANFINTRIVSRMGSLSVMRMGIAFAVCFSLLLFLVLTTEQSMYLVIAFFFVIIGSLGLISVNAEALILIKFPNQASSASAVTRTLRYSTGALVGPILAILYTGTPVPIGALVLGSVIGAALIQIGLYIKTKKPGKDHLHN